MFKRKLKLLCFFIFSESFSIKSRKMRHRILEKKNFLIKNHLTHICNNTGENN